MTSPQPSNELRCFCHTRPKLATFGIEKSGKLFIHVKVWKRNQIYGEIIVTDGVVRLRCRVCNRWHRVFIKQPENRPVLRVDREVNGSFLQADR